MFRIKTFNKISNVGLQKLDKASFQVSADFEQYEGILVRSANLHDLEFPKELRAIARAGAGTNNIPIDRCSENGIVVFNTPGANANAVKELCIAAMLAASRDIMGGSAWCRKQVEDGVDITSVVEQGKAAFSGPEIRGKVLGVIGLGAIGALVANAAIALGMEVYGYDPYLSVDAALGLDSRVHHVVKLEDIYQNADYITLHIPYNSETDSIIDAEAISKMKGNVRIINLARGELVDSEAIVTALESGRVACYVTDFPNNTLTLARNVVPLPHLGASSPESEENCAVMAACEIADYLESGNITNSVNLPNVSMPRTGAARICVIHRNVPAMLNTIMGVVSAQNVNVENMINKSKGEYAYTMLDVNQKVDRGLKDELMAVENVCRVRILQS